MSSRARLRTIAAIAILVSCVLCSLLGGTIYAFRLPNKLGEQDTLILGPSQLIPGAPSILHVQVQRHDNGAPLPDAAVTVSIKPRHGGRPETVYEGFTGQDGRIAAAFTVPKVIDPAQMIVVETASHLGRDRLEQPVTIKRSFRILLTTDKPIYQPGQQILVRALALASFDRVPASQSSIELVISDANGNKVFREQATTSAYGVASWSFQLADEVNHGNYKIVATLGDTSSEKTVVVRPYVLPKFKVTTSIGEPFYQPGQRVTGFLEAAYFFGKPVDSGHVQLTGWVYDVEPQQVLELSGSTRADGTFPFEFDLPPFFVGGLESGVADYILEIAVTDGAAHTEHVSIHIPVAQQGILIEAVPESGEFKPGLENILYLLTAYPDGSPAETDLSLTVNGRAFQAHTGPFGLGELRFTPDTPHADIQMVARDALGHSGQAQVFHEGNNWGAEQLLLRPERATYRVGETMNLEILTTQNTGTLYLDLTRDGQTLSTRSITAHDGTATAAVDLTPDLYGTLALHAYRLLSSGELVRDTRLVVVDAASDLDLDIRFDEDTYLPGANASLSIDIADSDGDAVQSALGLAIVDESVFALQEQDPGFARLYFLLEKELLEPKFDLHGLSLPQIMDEASEPQLQQTQDAAAKASLAGLDMAPFGLSANSRQIKTQQAEAAQAHIFEAFSTGLLPLLLAIPLAVVLLVGIALWREKTLGRSLVIGLGLPLLLAFWLAAILFLIPLPSAPWADTPLDKAGYLLEQLGPALLCFVAPALLGGLAGAIGLAVRAIRRAELSLALSLLLLIAYLILLLFFFVAFVASGAQEPEPAIIVAFVIAYLALPLAFGARAAGFALKREGWALLAAGLVALLAFFAIAAPLLALSAAGSASAFGARSMVLQAPPPGLGGEMALDGVVPAQAPRLAAGPSEEKAAANEGMTSQVQEPPLLRQFFPETMYWNPEAISDAGGHWQADLDLAHTITTWRLTAIASTQDGRLGSATVPIRVFQDFFVDIDLPLALTQGDEVSMPVAVYNYLDTAQQVQLILEQQDWFDLLGEPTLLVDLSPGDVSVVYFPIKVTATEGRFRPVVTAIGQQMSDATTLRHEVQVIPNGQRFDQTHSDRLTTDLEKSIQIPADAIPGTAHVYVKIYPGIMSQVVEGLDALLRMPFGCFEQTSSTTYPNVLVLDYLQSTSQTSPEVEIKAEQYINLGYQRLTTFEVTGGGFSLFGQAPADRMLTAYGLMEFTDMARVHPVDEAIVDRAANWLLSEQQADGSWENDQGLVHEQSWQKLGNERLPVTAYIVWALTEAGYQDETGTQRGLDYVREFWPEAQDPYVLALVSNALAAADPKGSSTQAALDRLAAMAILESNGAHWQSSITTFMGSTGQTGSIETTALAAYAILRAEQYTDLANQSLTYLIRQKDSYGTWHSTQATVLTLKVMLLSIRKGGEGADATVRVSLNGEETGPLHLTKDNSDVVQLVSFTDQPAHGENKLRIGLEGKGNLMYQVNTRYYLPWNRVPQPAPETSLMNLAVEYDRTELAVNDVIHVSVRVEQVEGACRQAIVDLGIPPGFEVLTEDLEDLVARHSDLPPDYPGPKFSRFDLTGRQIIVYLEGLQAGQPLEFGYRIRARYPIRAQSPPSTAYDYYNPAVSAVSSPTVIEVMP